MPHKYMIIYQLLVGTVFLYIGIPNFFQNKKTAIENLKAREKWSKRIFGSKISNAREEDKIKISRAFSYVTGPIFTILGVWILIETLIEIFHR